MTSPVQTIDAVSTLEKRIAIRLGLLGGVQRALTGDLARLGFGASQTKEQGGRGSGGLRDSKVFVSDSEVGDNFQPVPQSGIPSFDRDRLTKEIAFLRDSSLTSETLRGGISIDNYRVALRDLGSGFPVVFHSQDDAPWLRIATYKSWTDAVDAINSLRRFLIACSVQSEGVHLIDHILLRPSANAGTPTKPEFHSFRISALFPDWTARFSDAGFRTVAERVVRDCCPAHVHVDVYWVAFPKMQAFEELLERWERARGDANVNPQQLDAASASLKTFLVDLGTTSADEEKS